jgi:uncharacterized membrane protein HdeD (DUF308 family)
MNMFVAAILGIVDILAGIIILFNFHAPGAFILFLILFVKGLMSMMADTIGKIYGFLDIIAGIIILFGINAGLGLSVILFLFFIYKGLVSIIPR